jgi:hypothetical protein
VRCEYFFEVCHDFARWIVSWFCTSLFYLFDAHIFLVMFDAHS